MHELGLCDAMLKMIRGIAKDNDLDTIRSVTVEVGTLSGVMPAFLSECWTAVIDGTEFADVPLIVKEIKGQAQCMDCGEVFEADLNKLRCPKCNGEKLIPLSGKDMTIKEIMAD